MTPAELTQARRRSGRLGGRPRRLSVSEARRAKLEELVPKALAVLEQNLASESEQVRQRAAEQVLDRAWGKPVTPTRDETFALDGGVAQLRELSDRDLEVRLAALPATEVA